MSELSHWLSLLSLSRHSNQSCTSTIYEESFLPIFQVFVARFWIHIKIVEVKACIRILKKELGMFQIQVGYLWLTVSMHNSTNSDYKLLKCRERVVILQSNHFKVFLFTHIVFPQIRVSVIHTYQIKENYSSRLLNTNSDLFYNHTLLMIVS